MKPCRWAGCPALIQDGRYCPRHQPRAERIASSINADRERAYRQSPAVRESKRFLDSRDWKRARADYLTNHPFCEQCQELGLSTLASQVHHKTARSKGGALLDDDNLMALCASCHSRLTVEELRDASGI